MDLVEIFAGILGAGLGYAQAGLRSILAVERDSDALTTLALNHPKLRLDPASIGKVKLSTVYARNGIKRTFSGCQHLSPPCQDVSRAGPNRGRRTERNDLLFTVPEACEYAPDSVVIMENVAGLDVGDSKALFLELKERIADTGRDIAEWHLDGLDWDLAQTRSRIFLVMPPRGEKPPVEPIGPRKGLAPRTLREAIHPSTGFVDPDDEVWPLLPNERILFRDIPPGGCWMDSPKAREYAAWRSFRRGDKARDKNLPWQFLEGSSNLLRRLSWDLPAPTVVGRPPTKGEGRASAPHPDEERYLSTGEARELQQLPRDFLVYGSARSRRVQVGNMVPPPLSRAVGEAILGMSSRNSSASRTRTPQKSST